MAKRAASAEDAIEDYTQWTLLGEQVDPPPGARILKPGEKRRRGEEKKPVRQEGRRRRRST